MASSNDHLASLGADAVWQQEAVPSSEDTRGKKQAETFVSHTFLITDLSLLIRGPNGRASLSTM